MIAALLHRLGRRPAADEAPTTVQGAVRPPGAFQDSGRSGWRRWLARAPLDVTPADLLPQVKGEFCALLDDVLTRDSYFLMVRIGSAASLRELWHLRSDLFCAIARHHSQAEAERRLAKLNRHFPLRPASPRASLTPLAPR